MFTLPQSTIFVRWVALPEQHDDWQATRCLYAYLAPDEREILYVGMTWDQTVRARWNYSAKPELWDYLEHERGMDNHITLAGHIDLASGRRLTRALLADIESLLINELPPCGNVQAIASRISRPGMVVQCLGEGWPGPQQFYDQ